MPAGSKIAVGQLPTPNAQTESGTRLPRRSITLPFASPTSQQLSSHNPRSLRFPLLYKPPSPPSQPVLYSDDRWCGGSDHGRRLTHICLPRLHRRLRRRDRPPPLPQELRLRPPRPGKQTLLTRLLQAQLCLVSDQTGLE